jgi:hypothetical protein
MPCESVLVATAPFSETVDVELEVAELAKDLRLWLSVGTQASSGGIVSWSDHESGQPAFEYPEITGYSLTHFVGSPLQGEERFRELDAGRRAANWLIYLIDTERLAAREGWDGDAVYNFDLAMMANGLMAFGLKFDEDRFVDYGLFLARRLIEQLEQYGDLPSIDHQTLPLSQRCAWSTHGSAHLVKVAQCMLNAAELGLDLAREAASAVVDKGLAGQQPDGRITTDPDDEITMLHPHLYAVEGLWVYGEATGNEDALACARSAVAWAYQQRLSTGGFPRFAATSDGQLGPEQCDVTAQFLRAALLTGFEGDLYPTTLRLCSLSLPVPGMGRAMPYQPDAPQVHRNVWASMFAAQGCELFGWDRPQSLNWRHLV